MSEREMKRDDLLTAVLNDTKPETNADTQARRARDFHEAYERKCQECREKEFPEPGTTAYGMGYGDGYKNATREAAEAVKLERERIADELEKLRHDNLHGLDLKIALDKFIDKLRGTA